MIKFYNIFCLPSLIIHESFHVLTCLLVLSKWTGIKIDKYDSFKKTMGFSFTIFTVSTYRFQNTLIHISPILAIFIGPIISLYSIPLSIFIMIYQLLTISIVVPSYEDLNTIKNFRTLQEELLLLLA